MLKKEEGLKGELVTYTQDAWGQASCCTLLTPRSRTTDPAGINLSVSVLFGVCSLCDLQYRTG